MLCELPARLGVLALAAFYDLSLLLSQRCKWLEPCCFDEPAGLLVRLLVKRGSVGKTNSPQARNCLWAVAFRAIGTAGFEPATP